MPLFFYFWGETTTGEDPAFNHPEKRQQQKLSLLTNVKREIFLLS